MPYPFNDMQGGMFGPPGGTQNLGGGLGQDRPMTDRDLQMLLGQLGSQSPTGGGIGGTLPAYDSPAPRGGPAAPQGVPGLGDSGIDPSMIGGAAGGGLDKMNFGTQAVDQGMGGMQDAIMGIANQKAEDERIRKLLEAYRGGGSMGAGMGAGAMQGPIGQSGANTLASQTGARMGYAPR